MVRCSGVGACAFSLAPLTGTWALRSIKHLEDGYSMAILMVDLLWQDLRHDRDQSADAKKTKSRPGEY